MLVTKCPQCEKEVTVPPGARVDSHVRCPLCSAEYSLQEAYAEFPPLLELVDAAAVSGASHVLSDSVIHTAEEADADAPTAKESSVEGFDFGQSGDDDGQHADFTIADPEERTGEGSFDFGGGGGTATATAPATSTGAKTVTARPRRKKQAANPAMEIVKVIIGGLIALPIAQMILWWLPGDWKRDPISLAPQLPSYIAFLAPASLRDADGADSPEAEGSTDEPTAAAPPALGRPPRGAVSDVEDGGSSFGRDDLNAALLAHNNKNNGRKNGGNKNNKNNGENGEDEPGSGSGGTTTNEDPFGVAPPDLGSGTQPGEEPGTGGEVKPKPPVGPKNAPKYESADLAQPLEKAKESQVLLEQALDGTLDPSVRVPKFNEYQDVMFELAHFVTYAPGRSEGYDEHLAPLAEEIVNTPDKRKAVARLGQERLKKQENRKGDGVILLGQVKDIQPRGQLFETVVELSTPSKRPVSVYGTKDPGAAMHKGDTVLILGAIIDEPGEEIAGYKGPDEPVVWGGFSHIVE